MRAGRAMLDLATAPDVVTQTLRLSEADRRTVFDQMYMLPIYDTDWFHIVSFLQRQWFRRAWVVQEVGQARVAAVICSHDCWLDFTVLVLVAKWMVDNQKDRDVWMKPWFQETSSFFQLPNGDVSDLIGRGIRSVAQIRDQVRSDGLTPSDKKSSLLELLVRFWKRDASVAHDKVYALMSLCQDATLIDSIPVDYARPAAEVYTETARGILQSMGRLDLLMYSSGDDYTGRLDLPSWVPDWSMQPGSVLLGHDDWLGVTGDNYEVTFPFCADGNVDDFSAAVWEGRSFRVDSGSSLTVQGKMVATIKNTASLQLDDSLMNVLNDLPLEYSYLKPVPLQSTCTPQNSTASGYQAWARSNETRFEALWRTALRDTWKGYWPATDEAGLAFVRLLADELGEWIKKSTEVDKVDLFLESLPLPPGLTLAPKPSPSAIRAGPEAMIRFLAADERRCLDERRKTKRPNDAPSGLVTEPRKYLPEIEPGIDMANFVATFRQEYDKDLHLLRSRGCLTGQYTLFSTDNHKLGIAPSAQSGDQVWILNGAGFPVILRSPVPGFTIVVGSAYVHGIMHGQELGLAHGATLPVQLGELSLPEIMIQ